MQTQWLKESELKEHWYQVDAAGKILGRLACLVAKILQGKNDVRFLRGVNFRNYVVVLNSDRIHLTGRKEEQKVYYRHTGYTGHLKTVSFSEQMKKDSTLVIKRAVKGMLPSNTLGRCLLKNLKVFKRAHHNQQAQKPVTINFD